MTTFKRLTLRDWRQFANITVDFHPRLTIITGANGAGKSTILNVCSQHLGFARPFVSTPKRARGGGILYDHGYHGPRTADVMSPSFDQTEDDLQVESEEAEYLLPFVEDEPAPPPRSADIPQGWVQIGSIEYENGLAASLGFPEQQAQAYGLTIFNQQAVPGVPIGSHRSLSTYQPVQGVSLGLANLEVAYQAFFGEMATRMSGQQSQFSPIYRMKEALIAMAAFGEGNQHLDKNEALYDAFDDFEDVLRKVLPREIGFQKLTVRLPDIVLKTKSGEFVLDASSGGVTAIIEIAWQLFLYGRTHDHFTATLDEPENHLHPTMQRSILSNLIDAFPQVQFIVATHSPFIVSAVEDSRVYALRYMGTVGTSGLPVRGPRRVRSIALDQTSKAANASEILRDVLGVSVSIPHWAEHKLKAIIDDFQGSEITKETLSSLRRKLSEAGFSEYYPEAVAGLVGDR